MRCLPRHPQRLRLTRPYPSRYPAFTPSFGSAAPPFQPGGILGRRRALSPGMTCHLRHLGPEALAPDGLCCPAHRRLIGLIRQSGELRAISRIPVMGAVLDIQGSQHPVCSPHRTFTAELSGIAAVSTSGTRCVLTSVLPHRRWPSGRVETLGIYQYPRKSDSMRGAYFAASDERSLSLRPSRLLASPSDRTEGTSVLPAHGGFYVPASGRRVAPTPVGI